MDALFDPAFGPSHSPNARNSIFDPHVHRTQNWCQFFEESGLLVECILEVLTYMKGRQVDLPILLWAVSWNTPELISNASVQFEHTALMMSKELLEILLHWHRPPWTHGAGTRMKAAHDAMEKWAFEIVGEVIDAEMHGLKSTLTPPEGELTEESLLSISWKGLIKEVLLTVPCTWAVFRQAAYTAKQDSRNTVKNPDAVRDAHLNQ